METTQTFGKFKINKVFKLFNVDIFLQVAVYKEGSNVHFRKPQVLVHHDRKNCVEGGELCNSSAASS